MITKFLSKLKSILFKSSVPTEAPLKKPRKSAKSAKTTKSKTKSKSKLKKGDAKKTIESLTTLPGVGAKSAKAFYDAGFKTTKSLISADEKDLLAVPGVGVNLVKKLKKLNK